MARSGAETASLATQGSGACAGLRRASVHHGVITTEPACATASWVSTEVLAAAVVVLLAALGALLLHEGRVRLALARLGPRVAVEVLVSAEDTRTHVRRRGAPCSIAARAHERVHECPRECTRARARGCIAGPTVGAAWPCAALQPQGAAHIGDPGYFFPRKSNHSQHEYLHELSMYSGFVAHCPSAAHW